MKRKVFLISAILIFVTGCCNNSSSPNEESESFPTTEESSQEYESIYESENPSASDSDLNTYDYNKADTLICINNTWHYMSSKISFDHPHTYYYIASGLDTQLTNTCKWINIGVDTLEDLIEKAYISDAFAQDLRSSSIEHYLETNLHIIDYFYVEPEIYTDCTIPVVIRFTLGKDNTVYSQLIVFYYQLELLDPENWTGVSDYFPVETGLEFVDDLPAISR